MMSSRSVRHVVMVLAAMLAVGCAPTLRVNVLQPVRVDLGSARRLTVVQTAGRKSARDLLVAELTRQASDEGYYQVMNRSDEGIVVKVAGRTVKFLDSGSGTMLEPDELGVRVDINDWDAEQKTEKETFYEARAVASVTAFTSAGKALIAEEEYETTRRGEDKERAIGEAARALVRRLLHDITPRYAATTIRLDDGDQAQKPILEVARHGDVPRAITELESYVKANPGNPAALYHLAALLDASGRYPEALELYTQAITLSAKDYYVDRKAECSKRLADQQALER
ncbi:tetratricopeptide repeat protein [Vitiosangium sp. GDMCC 1.1324]|uniref:tetratricopeptide repeat protein n=1 Tax=Vitiosangium sp. (strain GDMCC 1.1324) TaxID=2138576 RepID=UPI000D3D2720|nr:tetratricopeptide repeat protein [Vitiosangium sp. GDMCC 1.1324]PTL78596.1 hypothetical protein DAT35_39445 [Vitiosangium sp. GDMCC 1.1324]